jgi:hypothetical protein
MSAAEKVGCMERCPDGQARRNTPLCQPLLDG